MMEAEVRTAGAVPPTVAVIAGRITVGAAARDLERLTSAPVMKIAARDLAVACGTSAHGGTTVSATAAIADLIGIPVVATGGIGGGDHGEAERSEEHAGELQSPSDPVSRPPP